MATRNNTFMHYGAGSDGTVSALTLGVHMNECSSVVIDLSGNPSTTVSAGPAILFGIHVGVALSAHTVDIEDGATVKLTLAASTAAGTQINCHGLLCNTSLIVNPNDSSTGTITVFYKAL